MIELSGPNAENHAPLAIDADSQIAKANKYALYFLTDSQKVLLDEMLFAGSALFDRTVTETHLFNEFLSKMAGAHSLKDISEMYRECTRHQLEFIRRDAERFFKHGERVMDNTSKLVDSWRQS